MPTYYTQNGDIIKNPTAYSKTGAPMYFKAIKTYYNKLHVPQIKGTNCNRCGRNGHPESRCFAYTTIYGIPLS